MTFLANINVGSAPNDGTGDSLRTSFTKCNENFQIIDDYMSNGNLSVNIASTGTSTFNNVIIGGSTISNGIITANGNISSNGSISVTNDITAGGGITVSGAAAITGNLSTGNINSTGFITTISSIYANYAGLSNLNVSGSSVLQSIQHSTSNQLTSNTTTATVNFSANTPGASYLLVNLVANSNVVYNSVTAGVVRYAAVVNNTGSTKYITLPNDRNNKGTNLVPVSNGVTASFTFIPYDNTEANVTATIIND